MPDAAPRFVVVDVRMWGKREAIGPGSAFLDLPCGYVWRWPPHDDTYTDPVTGGCQNAPIWQVTLLRMLGSSHGGQMRLYCDAHCPPFDADE